MTTSETPAAAITPGGRILIAVLATAQGLFLYLVAFSARLGGAPGWRTGLMTLGIAGVALALFLLRDPRDWRPWAASGLYAALVFGLGLYTGHQCLPGQGQQCFGTVFAPFVLSQAVLWFILAFFAQTWLDAGQARFPYTRLLEHSWQNFLTLGLTGVLVGLFWAVLALWAALFSMLEIEFFAELFYSGWFGFPATGLVAGLGIILFRLQVGLVDSLRRILRALVRILLPLVVVVVVLFVFTLPFTGVQPLWDTGVATALLLTLVGLALLFTNASYQDSVGAPPYGRVLSVAILAALVVLPVHVGLGAFALALRVAQHGWSVDRLWAATLIAVLAGFTISYAVAIVWWRSLRMEWLRAANKTLAAAVAVVCALVATPLLDYRKITVTDQLARLRAGEVTPEHFDAGYFRFHLGRPGHAALTALRESAFAAEHPKLLTRVTDTLNQTGPYRPASPLKRPGEILDYLVVFPEGHTPPAALVQALYRDRHGADECYTRRKPCTLLAIDLNGDEFREYVLIRDETYRMVSPVYVEGSDGWRRSGHFSIQAPWSSEDLRMLLERGDYETVAPVWQDLRIGGKRIRRR